MAKARVTINPMYKGGAGGYTFYVRGGEQVLRQRKNNSNYGEGASRTAAQMIRRIRWGNLVNVFKAMKSWQPKAYDSKTQGQTDYNIFMALNVNKATAGSTKEMNLAGAAIWEAYQISRGSLPPIANSYDSAASLYLTDIKLTITLGQSTTVGQLSADIIANNPQFVAGDNIALILFHNWLVARVEFPYASTLYSEITLDVNSTQLVTAIPSIGSRIQKSSGGFLALTTTTTGLYDTAHEVGFVAIRTQRSANSLAVSSQSIVMSDSSILNQFSGDDWDAVCIASYGLTEEAPLEPSFKKATIESITANGSPIVDGAVLIDQQVIRVVGQNLYTPNFRFVADGVEFTPLAVGDGYVEFILTAAGSFSVYLNGSLYLQFSVDGIYPPSELLGRVNARQVRAASGDGDNYNLRSTNDYCLNYPFRSFDERPYFRIFVLVSTDYELNVDDFVGVGCTLGDVRKVSDDREVTLFITPASASEVLYVTFKGFIIFVANY